MNRNDLNIMYSTAALHENYDLLRIAVQNNRRYARSTELRAYLSSLGGTFDLSALLDRIDALLAVRTSVAARASPPEATGAYLFGVDPTSALGEVVRWCWVSPCRVRFFGSSRAIGLIRQEVDPLSMELATPGIVDDEFGHWFSTPVTPRVWLVLSGANHRVRAELLQYDESLSIGQIMVGSNSASSLFRAANNTAEPLPARGALSPMPVDESDRYEPHPKRRTDDRVRTIRARLVRVRPHWPGELQTAADEYMANRRNIIRETAGPSTLLGPDRPRAPPLGAAGLWNVEPFSLALHQPEHCTVYKLQLQGDSSPETLAWLIAYDVRPAEAPASIERRPREYTLVLMAHDTRVQAAFPSSAQPDIARVVMDLFGADVAWRFGEPGTLSLSLDWQAVSASSGSAPTLERWDLSAMND